MKLKEKKNERRDNRLNGERKRAEKKAKNVPAPKIIRGGGKCILPRGHFLTPSPILKKNEIPDKIEGD